MKKILSLIAFILITSIIATVAVAVATTTTTVASEVLSFHAQATNEDDTITLENEKFSVNTIGELVSSSGDEYGNVHYLDSAENWLVKAHSFAIIYTGQMVEIWQLGKLQSSCAVGGTYCGYSESLSCFIFRENFTVYGVKANIDEIELSKIRLATGVVRVIATNYGLCADQFSVPLIKKWNGKLVCIDDEYEEVSLYAHQEAGLSPRCLYPDESK